MAVQVKRSTADKIKLFEDLFTGLDNAYGTYDIRSGQSRQVKAPVTDTVLKAHLMGRQPYGIYFLVKEKTSAIVADFDSLDRLPPYEFISAAKHYELKAYIESIKSKGYHTWIFFEKNGVPAWKARMVVKHILEEIEQPSVEIFPKQDRLGSNTCYGNFINAPLFGTLVPRGKTVFVKKTTFKPHPDQWSFLESIKRVREKMLDEIIEINDLSTTQTKLDTPKGNPRGNRIKNGLSRFCLPPCAQKMLGDGVTQFQRVSCFRLAVHLKRQGLPLDVAVAGLKAWALKNRPMDGKQVITEREIIDQTSYAFGKKYHGYGCSSEAVATFCQPGCPVHGG